MKDDRMSLNRQMNSSEQQNMNGIGNGNEGNYQPPQLQQGQGITNDEITNNIRPPANAEIFAIEDTIQSKKGKRVKYRGKSSYVAGAVALIILLVAGTTGLAYYGVKLYQHTQNIQKKANGNSVQSRTNSHGVRIADGTAPSPPAAIDAENPLSYENRKCIQPNYVAQNGVLYVDYGTGTPIPLMIKGVTWRGMETKNAVPEGLSNGKTEGNNLYQIVDYLKRNNFNSVRLALSIDSVTRNVIPDSNLINTYSHAALDLKSYRSLLSSFIRGLAAQSMTVLLDFHTLTTSDPGNLWYDNNIHINDIQDAIKYLAKDMCNSMHWNVIGIDLKNAPNQGTWGDKSDTDWAQAATILGNSVVTACPNWLVFVQGVTAKHSFTFGGITYTYRDFDGAGLQNAMSAPIRLSVPNKVVYAPQFYNPSQTPFFFFYQDGNPSGVLVNKFVERDDASLKQVTVAAMNSMFGNISTQQNTLVLSAFGGLYGKIDAHPKKTSTRVLDNIINNFVTQDVKIAGGYLWALNPLTSFSYNPADIADNFEFALIDKTWRKANMELLTALKVMDTASGIGEVKCVRSG